VRAWQIALIAMLLSLTPALVRAQAEQRPFAWDVARSVLLDPTTYAPAILSHEAMRHDWKTSQVLFIHGWVEQNPRFTISGRQNDRPVDYEEGTSRIHRAAFTVLQYSALNNVGAQVTERLLVARYPSRKTLIRRLSWVERIAFASILAYRSSADHWRQASINRSTAREYGYVAQ
jgi:hypothetical protein